MNNDSKKTAEKSKIYEYIEKIIVDHLMLVLQDENGKRFTKKQCTAALANVGSFVFFRDAK